MVGVEAVFAQAATAVNIRLEDFRERVVLGKVVCGEAATSFPFCSYLDLSSHVRPGGRRQDAGAAHGGARAADGHLPSHRASGLRAG
eukprot:SAG11_NODE_12691_length_690_cov_1.384095_1_plen_87_part_00